MRAELKRKMNQKDNASQQFLDKAEDLSGQLMEKLNNALAGNALNNEGESSEEFLNWEETLKKDRDPNYKKFQNKTTE